MSGGPQRLASAARASAAGGGRDGPAHLVVFAGEQGLCGGQLAAEPPDEFQAFPQPIDGQWTAVLTHLDESGEHPVQRLGQLGVLVDVVPRSSVREIVWYPLARSFKRDGG